jgi:hypothetical protein
MYMYTGVVLNKYPLGHPLGHYSTNTNYSSHVYIKYYQYSEERRFIETKQYITYIQS